MNERSKFAMMVTVAVWAMIVGCVACATTMAMQSEEAPTNESWTRLAESGFDLQELDGLRRRNSQPLTGKDRDPMDSLLAIVKQWDRNGFDSIRPLGLLDLLADTRNGICRRTQMIGKVRQCLRIKDAGDSDPADGDADSGDSFQLTIFPDLDGQKITVKSPEGERVHYGRFAVTVRASALPTGETEQSMLGKRVRVDGFHYRFWRYDSVFSGQHGLNGQIGALVIGGPIEVLENPPVALLEEGLMWIVGLMAVGLLAMGWWYGRTTSTRDQSYDALPDMLPDDWKAD